MSNENTVFLSGNTGKIFVGIGAHGSMMATLYCERPSNEHSTSIVTDAIPLTLPRNIVEYLRRACPTMDKSLTVAIKGRVNTYRKGDDLHVNIIVVSILGGVKVNGQT
jgi:hypothetical protein